MDWFRDLKVVTKLTLGFGLLTLLAVFVGLQGLRGMAQTDESLEAIHEHHALRAAANAHAPGAPPRPSIQAPLTGEDRELKRFQV